MTDPNEALVEELARAICCPYASDCLDNAVVPNCRWAGYCDEARAVLPIIARVRDEALEEAARSVDALGDDYSSWFQAAAIREMKDHPNDR